jgi:hypothetical protein
MFNFMLAATLQMSWNGQVGTRGGSGVTGRVCRSSEFVDIVGCSELVWSLRRVGCAAEWDCEFGEIRAKWLDCGLGDAHWPATTLEKTLERSYKVGVFMNGRFICTR